MRILMVNNYARVTGGADRNALALSRELRARGHTVSFLSTASPENVTSDGAFIRARVTHANRDLLARRHQVDVAVSALWNLEAARAAQALISEFRPDVVHLHKLYPQLSVAPVVIAARAQVPVVQTLHDYELLSASHIDHLGHARDTVETKWSYRALNAATFALPRRIHRRKVDTFIACSQFLATQYQRRGSIAAEVLPYFVTACSTWLPFEEREGLAFVGRLQPEKGVADAIRVAQLLPRIPVHVVGGGPLAAHVRSAEKAHDNLVFHGSLPHSAVLAIVGRARVLIMPSRWQEPGGIAALEAMATGTPVVAYATGGLGEYVNLAQGVSTAVSPDLLAQASWALHEDRALWQRHSEAAVDSVARNHDPGRYALAVERIYRDLACARATASPKP